VVQQQERRERPKLVERQQVGPDAQEFWADTGWVEERGGDDEGSDRDQQGRSDDEDEVGLRTHRQGRHHVFDLGEVGERADVEADVHQLQQDEESVDGAVRGWGELLGCG